ncbi:hypothetical protein JCM10369A_00510 [Nocardioides pyridinolyticus]
MTRASTPPPGASYPPGAAGSDPQYKTGDLGPVAPEGGSTSPGLTPLGPPSQRAYLSRARVCRGCGGPLPKQKHQGNPRRWCSESCRVAAYRRAQKATAAGGAAR